MYGDNILYCKGIHRLKENKILWQNPKMVPLLWSPIFSSLHKSRRLLWFSRQTCVYVVCCKKRTHMLWFLRQKCLLCDFLQQKCVYIVIFTTKIVFLVFLVQTPVFPNSLDHANKNSKQRPFKVLKEKKGFMIFF